MDDPEVLRLFRRMEELKRLDHEFDIHGTWTHGSGHRYKSERVSQAELAQLESKLGVELPDQCRRWLTSVGRGAGPGYGLICRKGNWLAPLLEDPVPSRTVRDVSELTPELLLKFETAREESNDIPVWCQEPRWLDAAMRAWLRILIVAGPMKGHVVDVLLAAGYPLGVFAAGHGTRPGNVLPTFFEWLDDWIERSIKELPKKRELRRKMREILSTHQEQVRRRKSP